MFGSQVIETAIGLILMFFIVSSGASTIVEIVSRLVSKRSADLEDTLAAMLAGSSADTTALTDALNAFKGTSIYDAAKAAAGKSLFKKKWKRPSYLSAKSFADAIAEMVSSAGAPGTDGALDLSVLPDGVERRVTAIVAESGDDLLAVKAGLERWFDETMDRLAGAYKRWVTGILFVVGSVIAIAANASTFEVADRLWHDPVTRQVVIDAADKVVAEGSGSVELESVAKTADELEALGLPVGWDESARSTWDENDYWQFWQWRWDHLGYIAGWLVTGLLVTLGAPFWFDLLTKAASLRQSGSKPPPPEKDPTSATARVLELSDST